MAEVRAAQVRHVELGPMVKEGAELRRLQQLMDDQGELSATDGAKLRRLQRGDHPVSTGFRVQVQGLLFLTSLSLTSMWSLHTLHRKHFYLAELQNWKSYHLMYCAYMVITYLSFGYVMDGGESVKVTCGTV